MQNEKVRMKKPMIGTAEWRMGASEIIRVFRTSHGLRAIRCLQGGLSFWHRFAVGADGIADICSQFPFLDKGALKQLN